MRTCVTCGIKMMTDHAWLKLPLAERADLRAQGINQHRAHGRCAPCDIRARRIRRPRPGRPVADVAEDWVDLVDRRYSQKANVRALAPRLGMTEAALERAVLRAKRRGLIEVAA